MDCHNLVAVSPEISKIDNSVNPFFLNRKRVTGEEWLVRDIGAYLPGVYEEVRDNAFIKDI